MKTQHHVFREIGTAEIELTGKVADIGLVAENHNRIFRLLCAHLNPSTGEITVRLVPDNGVPAVAIDTNAR